MARDPSTARKPAAMRPLRATGHCACATRAPDRLPVAVVAGCVLSAFVFWGCLLCGLFVFLVFAVVGFAGRAVLGLRCVASCFVFVLPVVGAAVVSLRLLSSLRLAVRCGLCGVGCASALAVVFPCRSAACLAVGCGAVGCAGCRSALVAGSRLRVGSLSAVGSEVGCCGRSAALSAARFLCGYQIRERHNDRRASRVNGGGATTAGRRFGGCWTRCAGTVAPCTLPTGAESCPAFVRRSPTNATGTTKLGRLFGTRRSAALQDWSKTQDPADSCVLRIGKPILRRCYTLLAQLRHAVVLSTKGASTKAARLRPHPNIRRTQSRLVTASLPSLAADAINGKA